jgi:putative flavoprotein involved in K+ transport
LGDLADAAVTVRFLASLAPTSEEEPMAHPQTHPQTHVETHLETIVIGAGQAGLAAGYHLARAGRPFVILDGADQVGGSWLTRWDSLRLFTPSTHDALPGRPFPGGYHFPARAAMVEYLQDYAREFRLPVRTGVRVDGLFREAGGGFRVTAGDLALTADNVVVATGVHRRPRLPHFAADLSPDVVQLHSADYRGPGQLQAGAVLVVGAGNSGAEIAIELSRTHRTLLAGRHPGHLPVDIESTRARLAFPLIWFTWTHVLTERTPKGRASRATRLGGHGDELIRLKPADVTAAGVERTARIASVVDGRPQTEDGQVLDVANLVWATGFQPDFAWIDLPGLDASERLPQHRGSVDGQPGLYVLGQEFQYSYNSHTVGGVGREAAWVVRDLVSRGRASTGTAGSARSSTSRATASASSAR